MRFIRKSFYEERDSFTFPEQQQDVREKWKNGIKTNLFLISIQFFLFVFYYKSKLILYVLISFNIYLLFLLTLTYFAFKKYHSKILLFSIFLHPFLSLCIAFFSGFLGLIFLISIIPFSLRTFELYKVNKYFFSPTNKDGMYV